MWKECIGFRIENGFIVVYKGEEKLFKISNTDNNRKRFINWIRG